MKFLVLKMFKQIEKALTEYRLKNPGKYKYDIRQNILIDQSGKLVTPNERIVAEAMIESSEFLRLHLESFRDLFAFSQQRLFDASVMFLLRPLLELAFCKVNFLVYLDNEKKREVAVKYWLFIRMFVGSKLRPALSVQSFLNLGSADVKKIHRKLIKAGGRKVLLQEWGALFPTPSSKLILKTLARLNLPGYLSKNELQVYLPEMYGIFSLYQHGDPIVMKRIKTEQTTKAHVNRAFITMAICYNAVVHTLNELNQTPQTDLLKLNNKIGKIVEVVRKQL